MPITPHPSSTLALESLHIILTSSRLLVRESSLPTVITELKASTWYHSQIPPPFCPSSDSPAQVQTWCHLHVCESFEGAKRCSRNTMWSVWVAREVHEHWKHFPPQQSFYSAHPLSSLPLATDGLVLHYVEDWSNSCLNNSTSKSPALNIPLNSTCKPDISTWTSQRHLKFSLFKHLY